MSSIDERIVNMKFNNGQFLKGISATLTALAAMRRGLKLDAEQKALQDLDNTGKKFSLSGMKTGLANLLNLKRGLGGLKGGADSINNLDAAGRRFSLAGMATGVDGLSTKFMAMSTIGITALANLTNQAINAGQRIAKSLTVDPITSGLQEYEMNLTAIQTILASTKSKGEDIESVNAALAELNEYSDLTVYNFGQMVNGIKTLTTTGADLKEGVNVVKGFANAAALAGVGANEMGSALQYGINQAVSKGKMMTQDWMSLETAGIASESFKNSIMETARVNGVAVDEIVAKEGSFRDSLGTGWLTGDILKDTLAKYTGDLTEDQLRQMGYTEEQIVGIQDMAEEAVASATKVKTLSQLYDTLKEAAGSGWTQSWQLMFGDLEEAIDLFTGVSDVLGGMIGKSADARNKMLGDWNKLGGRTVLIEAIGNAFNSVMDIVEVFTKSMREIFPPLTGKQLFEFSEQIRDLTEYLTPSKETLAALGRIFKGVFAVLDIGRMILMEAARLFIDLFVSSSESAGGILEFVAGIGDWLVSVRNAIKNGEGLEKFFGRLGVVIFAVTGFIGNLVGAVGGALTRFFDYVSNFKLDSSGIDAGLGRVKERADGVLAVGEAIAGAWKRVTSWFKAAGEFFAPLGSAIAEFFGGIGTSITEAVQDIDFNLLLDMLNTGLLAGIALMLKNFLGGGFLDPIKDMFGGLFGAEEEKAPGLIDNIKEALGGLTETMAAMQAQLKATTLLKIAAAIGILAVSVLLLSTIDSEKLTKALGAITVMFTQLMLAMTVLNMIGASGGFLKLPFIAGGLMLLAGAILILSFAVKQMSDLSWKEMLVGLAGVSGLLLGIAAAAKIMSGVKGNLIGAGIGMIAIAVAIRILVSAVKQLSELRWQSLVKGLGAVGIVLGALALFTRVAKVSKGSAIQAAGLILLATALKIIASVVEDFSEIKASSLGKGLIAITGVLAALALFVKVTNGAKKMIPVATGMVILGAALKILASALEDFTAFSWEELGRGGAALAGMLVAIAGAMHLMPKNMLVTAAALAVVAGSLKILADVLEDMSDMSWEEIGKGLTVLGGSLIIIAGAMALMSKAIPGALALVIVAGALSLLTPVLTTLGAMEWEEIIRGLTMLAGVFVIIGLAGLILTPVIPALLGLGIAMALLGVGAIAVGAGLMMFAAGLTALSVGGAAATATLVGMVAGLLGLIPMALEQFGLGIVAFAGVIEAGAPAIIAALVAILRGLLNSIEVLAPDIEAALGALLTLLINLMVNNIPRMVDAGYKLLIGILDGIGNNIGQVIDSGTDIIVNFLNGLERNLPRINQAGADLIIGFVEEMGTTVRNNSERMRTAGMDLAGAIISGMTGGLSDRAWEVANEAANMAKNAFEAAKIALNINSPSKEFMKLGSGAAEGMAFGIKKNAYRSDSAAIAMGQSAIQSMKNTIVGIASVVDDEIDSNPVIRPVLDLSAVRSGASSLSGMMTTPRLSVSGTYSKASSLVAAERTMQTNQAVSKEELIAQSTGEKLTFIQNNYSPKALSAADSYRNTRNQISVAKEVLTKHAR